MDPSHRFGKITSIGAADHRRVPWRVPLSAVLSGLIGNTFPGVVISAADADAISVCPGRVVVRARVEGTDDNKPIKRSDNSPTGAELDEAPTAVRFPSHKIANGTMLSDHTA